MFIVNYLSFLKHNKRAKMEDTYSHKFKNQAYFFFKANLKMVRLAFTDVTRAQLLTEEVTSENSWPPNSPTMREITTAAFEVDDFFKIVEILRKRLEKFEAKNWRGSYNTMILVEYVLTHGPQSFAKEFGDDDSKQVLREMDAFHFVDDKGFDWGHSVRKLSGRILKFLEDEELLRQERIKARNLTRGIHGFGSLNCHSFPSSRTKTFNYNNLFNSAFFDRKTPLSPAPASDIHEKEEEIREEADSELRLKEDGVNMEIDHPFYPSKHHGLSQSLLENDD